MNYIIYLIASYLAFFQSRRRLAFVQPTNERRILYLPLLLATQSPKRFRKTHSRFRSWVAGARFRPFSLWASCPDISITPHEKSLITANHEVRLVEPEPCLVRKEKSYKSLYPICRVIFGDVEGLGEPYYVGYNQRNCRTITYMPSAPNEGSILLTLPLVADLWLAGRTPLLATLYSRTTSESRREI